MDFRLPSLHGSESSSSLSPGGCPLSLSAAVSNSSFFHFVHRRRKHSISRKYVFVVRGSSSTFELDEQREHHGFQTAESARERGEPVVKGRVAWSADGKANILWARRKQRDDIFGLREEHRSNRINLQQGLPVPSAGERKSSGSATNHQGASAAEHNNSSSVIRHHRASTVKHGDPISVTNQQRAFTSSHKIPERFSLHHGAPAGEHDDPISVTKQHGAIASSHRSPERFSLPARGQTDRSDSSSVSGLQIGLPVFKQSAEPDTMKPLTLSVVGSDAFVSHNESSLFPKGAPIYDGPSSREGTPQSGSVFTTKLEEILQKFRERPKRRGKSFEDVGATVARESPNIEVRSQVHNEAEPIRKGFQSSNYEAFMHKSPTHNKDANDSVFGRRKEQREERRSTIGSANARGHNTARVDSSRPTPWEFQRVGLPASEIQSPVRKGSSTFIGRQVAKTGSSQSYPKNARGWGTGIEKPATKRERRMRAVSQISDAQKYVGCNSDIDAEDNTEIMLPFTSDSEDEDSSSVQNVKAEEQMPTSSIGLRTRRSEPLVKHGKASWHSRSLPSLPFELQYSYSEVPNAPIVRYREKPFSPFGPEALPRPWTGGRPLTKSKKNLPEFDSFKPPPKGKRGVKYVQDPGPYLEGTGPKPARSRDEILGAPLTTEEIVQLVDKCQNENRQLNLGRDGLTHNMLDLVHSHWKRRRVIKIRCLGVPTVDMDNVCFHLEDKTGGKIIFRSGGVVYLFRGRNYNYKDRPHIPLMLWKPPTPVFPKLIRRVPEGLTVKEADQLRQLGQNVEPLCTLGKNGVYLTLVSDVRAAFKIDKLVRIDCRGLNPSDYKKIGAKLKDLVPCVLLSFDNEQILMWKGKETGSVDVGPANGKEAAEGSTTSGPNVGSASIGMNDLRVEGCADIPKNDIDTCSAVKETASLWSLDNLHASAVEGASPHTTRPDLLSNDLSVEESNGRNLIASNEVNSSSQIALMVQDEVNSDERNLVLQDTTLQSESATACWRPGHGRESDASAFSSSIQNSQFMDSIPLTEDGERELGLSNSAKPLESPSTKLDNSKSVGAVEVGFTDANAVVCINQLWGQAIASGVAIQLEEVEMDHDIVVKKTSELANAVPTGTEYTKQLLKKFGLRAERIPRPDDELRMHFRRLQRFKTEKMVSRGLYRTWTASVPEGLRPEAPQSSGMPVDELARLLSMR